MHLNLNYLRVPFRKLEWLRFCFHTSSLKRFYDGGRGGPETFPGWIDPGTGAFSFLRNVLVQIRCMELIAAVGKVKQKNCSCKMIDPVCPCLSSGYNSCVPRREELA